MWIIASFFYCHNISSCNKAHKSGNSVIITSINLVFRCDTSKTSGHLSHSFCLPLISVSLHITLCTFFILFSNSANLLTLEPICLLKMIFHFILTKTFLNLANDTIYFDENLSQFGQRYYILKLITHKILLSPEMRLCSLKGAVCQPQYYKSWIIYRGPINCSWLVLRHYCYTVCRVKLSFCLRTTPRW